jgi:hypothetical protein
MPAATTLPADVTLAGRGRAQKFVLAVLHFAGPSAAVPVTEIASSKRARGGHLLHFSQIVGACEALHKRGLLVRTANERGDCYALVAHTHA